MAEQLTQDQLAIIRIDGMHGLQSEHEIQKALTAEEGVIEVEVDFLSSQTSILFDAGKVGVGRFTQVLNELGYRAVGVGRSGET